MRTKAIGVTVILLVVGIAVFGWWSAHSRAVFAELEGTLAQELTAALGTRVTVGQLTGVGLTSATVADVAIYDKQDRELAAVKRLTVEYNLLSVLRGKTALDGLKKVTLSQPRMLLVQAEDGTWNAECLKQETKPDSPEFNGAVVLEQAALAVHSPKGAWDFTEINGRLDIKGSQTMDANLAANHNHSPLKLTGSMNNAKNSLALTLHADTLDPAVYQGLLPAGTELKFTGGLLSQVEVSVNKNSAGVRYAGKFALADLAAEVSGIKVEKAQGNVTFTNNSVYILGSQALVAGQPVTARGKIGIAGDQPVFDLNVASPGFDPAVFANNLPFTGLIKLEAQVAGTPRDPIVAANLAAEQATLAGYPLAKAKTSLQYVKKLLTVDEFAASVLGGQIKGQGKYDLESSRYQLQLAGEGIEAGAIHGLPVTLSGRGQLQLSASGQGSDWHSVTGAATINLAGGQINGIPYNTAAALVEKSGDRTEIEYVNMVLPAGFAAASGIIEGEQLAIKLSGQGIALQDIPYTAVKNIQLAGTAAFDGELTGTTAAPAAVLNFDIAGLKANDQAFGKAAGKLKANANQIDFEQVQLTDGTASHELQGKVLLTGAEPALDLKVLTRAARAESFVRLAMPDLKLTGNVDHELLLTGPLSNPAMQGRIKLTEGSLYGQLIAKAEGAYERKNGMFIVNNLDIFSLNTKIKLAGTVGADNSLNFAVTAEDIDIARLRVNYPYPVAGKVNVSGLVTGTVAKPVLAGQLESPLVMLNGQEITQIASRFSYDDGHADIRELRFRQGAGSYAFAGAADLTAESVDGILRVEGGELAGILAIANVPDRGIRGRLDGEIALSGLAKNPNVLLRGVIHEGRIKNYPLDSIDIDVELANKIITINKFMGKQGTDGLLVARGQADLNGAIDMEVGGRDIQTGILTALFDTTVETKGKFSFNAQATGATADPNVAVSLDVKNGSIANAEFDNLYGLFIYNQGSIHVNQLFLARGPYKASAYGLIPLKALNSQGRSQGDITDRMDLKVRLDNADLSILPMLTKEVSWASGPTAGEISIGGTLAQPVLSGQVTVNNGTVKLVSLGDLIENVGVEILFEGDTINVNTFDGKMGGGSFALAGSARLNGLVLDNYNLALTLAHLGIKHKYFAGPVDGVVSLTSDKVRPRLYGKLTIDNATVNIPAVPEGGDLDLDAGLDIEVLIGDKVRMYNPYLYDFRAAGKVKLAGTVKRPSASGRVEARRGTIRYLTNRFNIESASAEFTQFRSVVPIIKLKATAKLQQTTVNLAINGPATAMDLKLTSEPSMSQQEIISILTLQGGNFSKTNQSGYDSVLGRDQLVSLLDAGLQMRFLAEVENSMQSTLGVDEFKLVKSSIFDISSRKARENRSNNQYQGYNLEIGKYLTDKLLVSYSVGLEQNKTSISLRYDLTKRITVGGAFASNSNTLLTVETRFNF